jgi:hypothetical protein
MTVREAALAALLIVSPGSASAAEPFQWGKPDRQAVPVSMVELLSVGQRFNGWSISVVGVLHFSDERSIIFLSREAYENFDTASAIGIVLNHALASSESRQALAEASGQYVWVQGRYQAYKRRKLREMEVTVGVDVAGFVEPVTGIGLEDQRR